MQEAVLCEQRCVPKCLHLGNGLYFTQYVLRQGFRRHAASCGLGSEEFRIYLVKDCKILYICKEAGGFEYLFKA
jgi:hypothetical protein